MCSTRLTGTLVLTGAMCLGSSLPALAQTWTRQSPHPANDDVRSIFFTTAETGWIVGKDEVFMRTDDGGATWAQSDFFARDPLFEEERINAVQFVDAQHGFAGGDNVYRTTDGGETWQDMGFHSQVVRMEFISPLVGFITGNGGLRRTIDGGQTFETIGSADDIDFFDQSPGLYVEPAGVFRSTDGGETWELISGQPLSRVLHLTEDIVIATEGSTYDTVFLRSTDGGETWEPRFSENTRSINGVRDLARIDADSAAAIDLSYRIWITDDAGLTWERTHDALGNWDGVTGTPSIHFPSPQVGYAAGSKGIILKSLDGGHSWEQISSGAAVAWNDIDMAESGLGFAVGPRMTVLRTTDFGRHWSPRALSDPSIRELLAVQVIDADTVVVCGEGEFWRSDDAGVTWVRLVVGIGTAVDLEDIHFLNEDEGWLFGLFGAPVQAAIYHTNNGGETWTRVDPGNHVGVLDGQMRTAAEGWSLNISNRLYLTEDNWQTIDIRTLPGSSESYESFEFASEDVGWFVGLFGTILKTEDGGVFFDPQPLPGFIRGSGSGTDRARDIAVLSPEEAYIATYRTSGTGRGIIYQTTDGGQNWSQLNHIFDPSHQSAGRILEIDVLAGGDIWSVSPGGGYIFSSISQPVRATLTGLSISDGEIISGGLPELEESDDAYLHTEARVTGEVHQPHLLRLRITAETNVENANGLTITTEGHITDVEAQTTLLLRDWVNGGFDQIDKFSMTMTEETHETEVPQPANYVRAADGVMRVEIKQIVFFPFTLNGFHTLLDQVEFLVR